MASYPIFKPRHSQKSHHNDDNCPFILWRAAPSTARVRRRIGSINIYMDTNKEDSSDLHRKRPLAEMRAMGFGWGLGGRGGEGWGGVEGVGQE